MNIYQIGYVAKVKKENKGIRVLVDKFNRGSYTTTKDLTKLFIFETKESAKLAAQVYNKDKKNQYDFEIKKVYIETEEE